jgi:hypothetical protein
MKKDYTKEGEALRAMRDWIDYRQTCCRPQKTIREWFEALKELAGMSNIPLNL